MKFNITDAKLERWVKQEEGCLIAAGTIASEKTTKSSVPQGLDVQQAQFTNQLAPQKTPVAVSS